MTQPSLFDTSPRPTLPHSGLSRIARECSVDAARAAAPRRGRLQERYLEYLRLMGSSSDHQAAAWLRCPLSSVNSTRGAVKDQVVAVGKTKGPYGTPVTLFALRGRP
jgi:hypothetical protein